MKRRILVVDDQEPVRRVLHEVLVDANYEVLLATTFEEGRELADTANPDLLLVDIRLGNYNGLQLAVRGRITHPDRPVIVMTGHADPVLQAEARRHGAEFIEKPFDPKHLVAMIRRLAPPASADHGD